MICDFTIFDWTALGAATSLLMAIAAFITIRSSVKQNDKSRRLQIQLIRQQQAQQKLDDMVGNILQINYNMNPFHILHYSSKLTSRRFTEEDRQALEKLAVDDYLNNTNLLLQYTRLGNYQSAKPLLDCLNHIRNDYGLWSRTVSFLSKLFDESVTIEPPIEQRIIQITEDMSKRCLEIAPQYETAISEIRGMYIANITKALNVLTIFQTEMARHIQKQQKLNLDQELVRFVKSEQQRIDKMVE